LIKSVRDGKCYYRATRLCKILSEKVRNVKEVRVYLRSD